MVIAEIVGIVLLADFVSGLVHWLEDTYAKPDMKIFGKIAEENFLHHSKPREFLKKNWWQSSWDLALLAILLVAIAWAYNWLSWQVGLFAVLTANANQFHKWSHRNKQENGILLVWLQRLYLLQTPRHHARHHTGEKDSHYCVITNFLNPLLEEIDFWRKVERGNSKVFGVLNRRVRIRVM